MTTARQHVIDAVREHALPLQDASNLDALVEAARDAKIVLLGEASHGTSEYYRLRTELSKKLIENHGFNFIAVEGDWPPCYEVNRYIKRFPGAKKSLQDAVLSFNRWPAWMWANEEVRELVRWLHEHNDGLDAKRRVGFYGLDVYSLWESMDEVIRHLEQSGQTQLLETAKQAFACFEPYDREGQQYGVSAAYWAESCEDEVVQLLQQLQEKRRSAGGGERDEEAALSDELNALVAKNAEQYYRTMIRSDSRSWNVRDEHMTEALGRLLTFHGPDTKAIIWEHNTHIGDARATDMAAEGMVNVGQLVRERYGRERCFAVGFGTHRGTVIAGQAWGAQAETMRVPSAVDGSWEDILHVAGEGRDLMLMFAQGQEAEPPSRLEGFGDEVRLAPEPAGQELFRGTFDHRAIGVVYHPSREHWGNYVPSVMSERYDAFVFVDRSEALHPLAAERVEV